MLTPELCREPKHREAASLLIIVSTLISLGAASTAGLGITSSVTAGVLPNVQVESASGVQRILLRILNIIAQDSNVAEEVAA